MKFFCIVCCLFSICPTAQAHKMGDSPWCLHFNFIHQECFYESSVTCQDALKHFLASAPANQKLPQGEGAMDKKNFFCAKNEQAINFFSDKF